MSGGVFLPTSMYAGVQIALPSTSEQVVRLVQSQSQDAPPVVLPTEQLEMKTRMAEIEGLVTDAVEFFRSVSLAEACRQFESSPRWRKRGAFVFVFGNDGTCYIYDDEQDVLWRKFGVPLKGARNVSNTDLFIEKMLEIGRSGGWMSFKWNNDYKSAYVRTIEKYGTTYIIGSGFYPESARYTVEQLILRALEYGRLYGAEDLFRTINNFKGEFVIGPLYLWAYSLEPGELGDCVANGGNIALVGSNQLDYQDSAGFYRNREIIKQLETNSTLWIDYQENGILKRAYVARYTDIRTGKSYFIGCGYYPTLNAKFVSDFVKRAVNYLRAEGSVTALRDFVSRDTSFFVGPLRLFVYDVKGKVLADADYPEFIGQNLFKSRDEEGVFFVQEIIRIGLEDRRGWTMHLQNGAYKDSYIEYVKTPDGEFIVGAGYWPMSRERTTESMLDRAAAYLRARPLVDALADFVNEESDFLRGDLYVTAHAIDGTCLCAGRNLYRIWNNELGKKDIRGRSIIQQKIELARKAGFRGTWFEYTTTEGTRREYIALVNKTIAPNPAANITPIPVVTEMVQVSPRQPITERRGASREDGVEIVLSVGYWE